MAFNIALFPPLIKKLAVPVSAANENGWHTAAFAAAEQEAN